MKAVALSIPDVVLIEPRVFEDNRGYFYETFNKKLFEECLGRSLHFVQDNQSRSSQHVLRGLHYQIKQAQGKLVRVIQGEILDVTVDLRQKSETFGQWLKVNLSSENRQQLWIPEGFAHGFIVLSEFAVVQYKTTDYWSPPHERCIAWNDPDLGIQWPDVKPILGDKDKLGVSFKQADLF